MRHLGRNIVVLVSRNEPCQVTMMSNGFSMATMMPQNAHSILCSVGASKPPSANPYVSLPSTTVLPVFLSSCERPPGFSLAVKSLV